MTIYQEIEALISSLATTTDPEAEAEIILDILAKYVAIRSTDGLPYIDQLLRLADTLDNNHYRAWALYHHAIISRHQGNYSVSLDLSAHAQMLFRRLDESIGIANCYNTSGLVLQFQGNYAEALKNHLEALRIREEIGDKKGIANSYTNIALIYDWQKNYDAALENNHRSLAIMEELGNHQGIVKAYTNIGNIYFAQQLYDKALENHLHCQQIEQQIGNKYGIAATQLNIGSIYLGMERYEEAMQNYVAAKEVFEEMEVTQYIAMLDTNIGLIYFRQGDYQQALSHQIRGFALCEEMGYNEDALRSCESLTDTYRALGDYENAFKYFERYHQLDKEMAGLQAQKQLLQLNFQHDIDLKEKEALLLKEKNEAINIYAQKLEASNNALNQFAHVASHDLREPLRMVSSYMSLLEKTMGDRIEPVQKQFIGFAVDGAKRMEQLIHDLLRLAKVDANPQIETVSLMSVIDEVKNNLEILLREKKAVIIATDLPAIMADRTQIMQLCQNIIGNGIKYNENEQPTITIDYQVMGAEALLSIADNGIGIPAAYRERAFQIFQRVPTQKQYQGTGIGLAICKKIVDGLGGTISIDDNPTGGTVFYITVPTSIIDKGL